MEHKVHNLKQALTARAHTATLEELQSRGRRSVKVIRTEDVAQMIEVAVNQVIADSDLMSPEEAAGLEQKSRAQFQALLERRQAEVAENESLRASRDELAARFRTTETKREQMVAAMRTLELQRDDALARVRALEAHLGNAQDGTPSTSAGGMGPDIVYRLMGEIAELKARAAPAAAGQPAGAANTDALAGALQQLTSTFTAKLESFGRKIGVSSAVEADAPSLANLFKHQDGVQLESNMDNVTVKAKSATGIAANLERLKKLKGGG